MKIRAVFFVYSFFLLTAGQAAGQTRDEGAMPPAGSNSSKEQQFALVNFFVQDQFVKKLHAVPDTKYYTECVLCNTYPMDHVQEFLRRIRNNDTAKHYLDSSDLEHFRTQVQYPAPFNWTPDRIRAAKVTGKEDDITKSIYKVSVPLFSRNRKNAVIFVSCATYSRAYLYTYFPDQKAWELVTLIWQDTVK